MCLSGRVLIENEKRCKKRLLDRSKMLRGSLGKAEATFLEKIQAKLVEGDLQVRSRP